MRAKFLLKMGQALAWRRGLDLATLNTGAAGAPAGGQLLEGIGAYPEQFCDLRPCRSPRRETTHYGRWLREVPPQA